MFETNIVALHDQLPQRRHERISLFRCVALFRPRSRRDFSRTRHRGAKTIVFPTEVKKDVTQNGDECMLASVDDDTVVIVCTVVALNDEAKQREEEDLRREESKSSLAATTTGTKTLLFLARCKISGNDPNGDERR